MTQKEYMNNTNVKGSRCPNYIYIKMSKKEAVSAQLQSDHGPKLTKLLISINLVGPISQ